ncbi:MAG TPA: hypothetical protein VLI92_00600 [Candidatus Saccharimonadales bacterium]|nr:hypothetical protein [Candidatus Saccharimonadales bacterium]
MKLPSELTTVTRVSKFLALLIFIIFPFAAFNWGIKYQESIASTIPQIAVTSPVKAMPAKSSISLKSATWDSYSNPQYMFSVDVPIQWNVEENVVKRLNYEATTISISSSQFSRIIDITSEVGGTDCGGGFKSTPKTFPIGNQLITSVDFCGSKDYYLIGKTANNKDIKVIVYYSTVPESQEAAVNAVLKTIRGITIQP